MGFTRNRGTATLLPKMKPPPLPAEILRRVVRVSMIDGVSVLFVAGLCALASAATRDAFAAFIGLVVAGAGALEMSGASRLRAGDARGMRLLFWSHFLIGASMLVYVAVRLLYLDLASVHKMLAEAQQAEGSTREFFALLQEQVRQVGMTLDEYLLLSMRVMYLSLIIATALYQGGMTIYYARRRSAVLQALLEDEEP